MPMVDGKYEAKISTTFASAEKALEEIKKGIQKSRKVRLSNIPDAMLNELLPLLKGKDVMVILPIGAEPSKELKSIAEVGIQKAKIYKDFKGKEAIAGSIYLPDKIYSVTWSNGEIFQIDTMEYGKCVKCMKKIFEMSWRYAKKVKS
jgi:hypothetical protein